MDDAKATKQLLETYYQGFAQKEGWESVISEDFKFVGGDMNQQHPVTGKSGYIDVITRLSRVFEQMRVKKMIVEGENACVVGNYDLLFPNGKRINADVAEVWKAADGKLASLTIFFDTLTFALNTPK